MERLKWIDRKFVFDIPPGWLPDILERLYGTGIRLHELTSGISDAKASLRMNNAWSIKEHIGHLIDLEELHQGRINDFILRKKILRAADMSNRKTNEANHNQKPVVILISEFMESRNTLVNHLQKLDDDTLQYAALHPRLKKPMRPVDMAFFTAEHDDHHLASIRILINAIS